jgi:beta-lactamase class A
MAVARGRKTDQAVTGRVAAEIGVILLLLILAALPVCAQSDAAGLLERKMHQRIRDCDARFDGVLGVAALDLTTGRLAAYHGDAVFPQASSIKIPILIELHNSQRAGRLRLSDSVTLGPADVVGGDGSLQHRIARERQVTLTVQDLARAMILESDNTATNRLIAMVGMERVNHTLNSLGLTHTRLRRKMMDAAAVRRGDENISTPVEMVRLMELLYSGKILDRASCDTMLALLKQVKDAMRQAVPARYAVASKWGRVDGVACETGIVYLDRRPFALSVMSTFHGEHAENPVAAITGIVFDHFERLAHSNGHGNRFEESTR